MIDKGMVIKSAPPDVERVYIMTPKDFVMQCCIPWQGAEVDYPEFKKYGYTVTGIYEKWHWYTKADVKPNPNGEYDAIDNVTYEEAYKMVALTTAYWQPMHNKQSEEYQEYKRLDMIRRLFMNHPEQRAKYFADCPEEKEAYYKRFPEERKLYETE